MGFKILAFPLLVALVIYSAFLGDKQARGAFFPGSSVIKIDGREIPDDGTYIFMSATPSAGQFGTPRVGTASGGFTPSGSHGLLVIGVKISAGSCGLVQVGYSDSDRGNTNASNGANPQMSLNIMNGSSATAPNSIAYQYIVPNGKYPVVSPASQCSVQLIGREI